MPSTILAKMDLVAEPPLWVEAVVSLIVLVPATYLGLYVIFTLFFDEKYNTELSVLLALSGLYAVYQMVEVYLNGNSTLPGVPLFST